MTSVGSVGHVLESNHDAILDSPYEGFGSCHEFLFSYT